jgi:hypothetical protein
MPFAGAKWQSQFSNLSSPPWYRDVLSMPWQNSYHHCWKAAEAFEGSVML